MDIRQIFEAIEPQKRDIDAIANRLRNRSDVIQVLTALEAREYISGPTVEGYIDRVSQNLWTHICILDYANNNLHCCR